MSINFVRISSGSLLKARDAKLQSSLGERKILEQARQADKTWRPKAGLKENTDSSDKK